MKPPRILVINSCGKAKAIKHPKQPTCEELRTEKQRSEAIKRFSNLLVPAKKLYVGPQARAVNKAINLLKKRHAVDLYILSAGFGLVSANTLLPPYECSFSNKSKKVIIERARELKIPEKLEHLLKEKGHYNLIFLILGYDYLCAISNLSILKDYADKIVLFNKNVKLDTNNFEIFDPQILVKHGRMAKVFSVPIGPTVAAKGTILLNYAIDLTRFDKTILDLPFSQWWKNKIRALKLQLQEKAETAVYGAHYQQQLESGSVNYVRRKDYMVSKQVLEYIRYIVDEKVSGNEVKELWKNCTNLRSINVKENESINAYLNQYKESYVFYTALVNKIEELIKAIKEKFPNEVIKNIRGAIVNYLREKQKQMGYNKDTINDFKYALIKNIVNMIKEQKMHVISNVSKPPKKSKR